MLPEPAGTRKNHTISLGLTVLKVTLYFMSHIPGITDRGCWLSFSEEVLEMPLEIPPRSSAKRTPLVAVRPNPRPINEDKEDDDHNERVSYIIFKCPGANLLNNSLSQS